MSPPLAFPLLALLFSSLTCQVFCQNVNDTSPSATLVDNQISSGVSNANNTLGKAPAPANNASCDLTDGTWIRGPVRNYNGNNCPFINPYYNCDIHGRGVGALFQKWIWKPNACDLPRFDAVNFLTQMRNKVIAIAGDETATVTFATSLRCQINNATKTQDFVGAFQGIQVTGYAVIAYNLTVISLTLPFLVQAFDSKFQLAYNDPWVVQMDDSDPSLTSLLPYIDVLLLSSGTWFNAAPGLRTFKSNRWDVTNTTTAVQAHGVALQNTANSLLTRRFRGRAFFLTFPPSHWADVFAVQGRTCVSYLLPLDDDSFTYANMRSQANAYALVERQILSKFTNLELIDVLKLSLYRADAHVARYSGQPASSPDCTAWCIPGVPDTWTDLLYSKLIVGMK